MRIDIATAKKLISNYRQNHWTIINGACPSLRQNPAYPHVQDSRSVWFDLDTLQNFIDDTRAMQGNGVRFYFGEYSQDIVNDITVNHKQMVNENPSIQQYAGLHTLVLIPTTREGVFNRDFNCCDLDANNAPLLPANFSNLTDFIAENHGSMVPPPYDNQVNVGDDFLLYCDTNV